MWDFESFLVNIFFFNLKESLKKGYPDNTTPIKISRSVKIPTLRCFSEEFLFVLVNEVVFNNTLKS